MFFFRLSYSSDKNPGDYSLFVLFFVNYKDLLYCKIKRLETPSYSVKKFIYRVYFAFDFGLCFKSIKKELTQISMNHFRLLKPLPRFSEFLRYFRKNMQFSILFFRPGFWNMYSVCEPITSLVLEKWTFRGFILHWAVFQAQIYVCAPVLTNFPFSDHTRARAKYIPVFSFQNCLNVRSGT